jgi:hypothetical protein
MRHHQESEETRGLQGGEHVMVEFGEKNGKMVAMAVHQAPP